MPRSAPASSSRPSNTRVRRKIWTSFRRAVILSCPVWLAPALGASSGTAVPAVHAEIGAGESPIGALPLRRWYRDEVVIHVDASVEALGPQARRLVERAFGVWSTQNPHLPRVRFEHSGGARPRPGPDGRNTVSLDRIDFEGHRDDLAVAISYRNSHTGALREVDIIINADKPWASFGTQETVGESTRLLARAPTNPGPAQVSSALLASRPIVHELATGSAHCNGDFDLLGVMTHEAGHFFGLSENTQSSTATMYHTTAPCETQKRSLEPSDLRALAEAYAPAEPRSGAGRALGRSRPHQGSAATILLAWSLVWLLLVQLRLRRPDGRDTGEAQSVCPTTSPSLT